EAHPLPELLLLDLKMPRVSGFDVLIWLRSNKQLKNVPAVVLSSSDYSADMQEARALGATAYLVKPAGYDGYPKVVQALRDLWRVGAGAGKITTACTVTLPDGKKIVARTQALSDDEEVEIAWSGATNRLAPIIVGKYSTGFLKWYLASRALVLRAKL